MKNYELINGDCVEEIKKIDSASIHFEIFSPPFAGIGSEVYQALIMDRMAKGIELKKSYFDIACRNAESATISKNQLQLI